jgi:ribonuclease HI
MDVGTFMGVRQNSPSITDTVLTMNRDVIQINIDGAARGNPGPAAFAFVMREGNKLIAEGAECLGRTTNNVAEYTALVRALTRAAEMGLRRLLIYSDSELLVKQMNGVYRVKNADLREFFEEARSLSRKFEQVTIKHVVRENNSDADRLCNEALDGRRSGATPVAPAAGAANARQDVLDCLRTAAAAWAKGRPDEPPVEAVWDQLWSILQEHGLVRG